MRSRSRLLLALLAALLLAGCGGADPVGERERVAEQAWEALREKPSEQAYELFIMYNRMAAKEHGEANDAKGVRFQVRAVEAQAAEAERAGDENLAVLVQGRVNELEDGGLLEVYEEELPGSQARFLAARRRADAVLGE